MEYVKGMGKEGIGLMNTDSKGTSKATLYYQEPQ